MQQKLAFFSALEPAEFRELFGPHLVPPSGWEMHYFTLDFPYLSRWQTLVGPVFHYLSFPYLHQKRPYDLIIYFFNAAAACHCFSDLLTDYPGLVFLENLDLHRHRFHYLTSGSHYYRYLAELSLAHGQRGFEAGRMLLTEGEQRSLFSLFPLHRSIVDGSLGVVVSDPRYKRHLRTLYKKKRIFTLWPHLQNPEQAAAETLEPKPGDCIQTSKLIRLGVLFSERHAGRIDALQTTLNKLALPSPYRISISPFCITKRTENEFSFEDSGWSRLKQNYLHFIRTTDIILSENMGGSLWEAYFITQALQAGITVIVSASSLLGHIPPDLVFTVYPGRNEIEQVGRYFRLVTESPHILNEMSKSARIAFGQTYKPDTTIRKFHLFLNSIHRSQSREQPTEQPIGAFFRSTGRHEFVKKVKAKMMTDFRPTYDLETQALLENEIDQCLSWD